jgi:hypothetical protein
MSLRDELLAKIDVLAEYEAIGLRVAKGAKPNAEGWLSCHALGREDNNPSASINIGPNLKVKGIYKDFSNGLAMGLFNAVGGYGDYADGTHCYREMLTKYGFSVGNKNKTPPTLTDVKRYRGNLRRPQLPRYQDLQAVGPPPGECSWCCVPPCGSTSRARVASAAG